MSLLISPYALAVAAGGVVTLDPAKKGTGAALSGGNLTIAVAGGTASTALATVGYTTGKRYFEALVNSAGSWVGVGFSRVGGSVGYDSDLGQEPGEYAMTNGGLSYFAGAYGGVGGATYGAGDVIGVAIDFANRRAWWSKNGTFMAGNPGAGTGMMVTYASGLGTIFAALQTTSGGSLTARFAASDLAYAVPSGFSAYG